MYCIHEMTVYYAHFFCENKTTKKFTNHDWCVNKLSQSEHKWIKSTVLLTPH